MALIEPKRRGNCRACRISFPFSFTTSILFLIALLASFLLIHYPYYPRLVESKLPRWVGETTNKITTALNPTPLLKPIKDFTIVQRQNYYSWYDSHYSAEGAGDNCLFMLACKWLSTPQESQAPSTASHQPPQPTPPPTPPTQPVQHIKVIEKIQVVKKTASLWEWVCSVFFPVGLEGLCPPATETEEVVTIVEKTIPIEEQINAVKTADIVPEVVKEVPTVTSSEPTQTVEVKYPPYKMQVCKAIRASKRWLLQLASKTCGVAEQTRGAVLKKHEALMDKSKPYNTVVVTINNYIERYFQAARNIIILNIVFPTFWIFVYEVYVREIVFIFLHKNGHYFQLSVGIAIGIVIGSIHSLVPIYCINDIERRKKGWKTGEGKVPGAVGTGGKAIPNGTDGVEDLSTNWLKPEPVVVVEKKLQPTATVALDEIKPIRGPVLTMKPDHPYHIEKVGGEWDEEEEEVQITTSERDTTNQEMAPKKRSSMDQSHSTQISPVPMQQQRQPQTQPQQQQFGDIRFNFNPTHPIDLNNQAIRDFDNDGIGEKNAGVGNNHSTMGSILLTTSAHSGSLFGSQPTSIPSPTLTNLKFNSELWTSDSGRNGLDIDGQEDETESRLNQSRLKVLQSVQKSQQKLRIMGVPDDNSDVTITKYSLDDE